MHTLRFNPFGQIHKGLRALLYDTAIMIQQTDFTRQEEIGKVTERVRFVNEAFAFHADTEDHRIFPKIAGIAPEVVADFESQHQTDHELSGQLDRCLSLFVSSNSSEQNAIAGNELLQAFNSFLAFNVEHMKKEETVINAILWKHFSDADLLQIVREIAASVPMDENMKISAWMLKGMASPEIVAWYKGIQQTAPAFVFEKFCQLASRTLAPPRWNKVWESLQASPVTAPMS
ncbi:MAG TPA: hemerythrin domain-containing protein [Puia sp.]|nr:hemerythrin domain-containing protein [Puia sp.]